MTRSAPRKAEWPAASIAEIGHVGSCEVRPPRFTRVMMCPSPFMIRGDVMHPTVYSSFREIVAALKPSGRVLEIGAVPDDAALLAMPELAQCERIGINLAPPARGNGFEIIQGNANAMPMFRDRSFDLVISNATLEHDPRFWLTCAEIRRVTKHGGIAIIGVPGFDSVADTTELGLPRPGGVDEEGWGVSTLTYRYHGAPCDYYRFTGRAIREVFLEGFANVSVRTIMIPPRIIGWGENRRQEETSSRGSVDRRLWRAVTRRFRQLGANACRCVG